MPISWKTGTLLVSSIVGSAVGLKELVTQNKQVDFAPPAPVKELNLSPVNNSSSLYQAERRNTDNPTIWEPQTTDYEDNLQDINISSLKEEWRWFQPVNSSNVWDEWVGYTLEQKEKNRKEAEKNFKRLNDYTFKIFTPCGWGTGWILDYQLPKDEKEYPTTWYIATNAHVAWRLRFSQNPYHQILPLLESQTRELRQKYKEQYEQVKKYQGEVRDTCWAVDKLGHIDLNLSQQSNGLNRRADVGAVALGEMEEPKLFFGAFNYLDKGGDHGVKWNHYSDFAVIEIKFTDEKYARVTTNGFADKYKTEEPINVFGKPVERKYSSKKELWENKDNYYMLAYPKGARNKWAYTTNFNPNTTIATHLYKDFWSWEEEKNKEKLRGFVVGKKVPLYRFRWQGETFYELGHYLKVEYNPLDGGSSGGLYVDGEGNAIATTGEGGTHFHWAIPLRSDGVTEAEAGVNTPEYDLISGVSGQKSSYRQQVEKFLKPKGINTWLSSRGWK